MRIRRRSWFAAPLSLLCVAAIAGCGSSSSSSSTTKKAGSSAVPPTSSSILEHRLVGQHRRPPTPQSPRSFPPRSSPRARSPWPPTRAMRRTSSSARRPHGRGDGRRPDQGPGRRDGPQGQRRQRHVRHDHPRSGLGQVRPRRIVVHRHQGAREGRRLRRLLQRRHVLLHQGLGRHLRHRPRRPVRQVGVGREAGRPRRPTPRARARSARRPASRRSTCSCSRPERRQPGADQRPGADLDGRLAGGRLPGQAVERGVQARRPDLRNRALRAGDPQDQRPRPSRSWRPSKR